jgi:mycothiol synthase
VWDIDQAPPNIEGVSWRPLDRSDLAAVAELAGTCLAVDGGLGSLFDAQNLQARFFPEPPAAAIGSVDTGGRMAACAAVQLAGGSDEQQAVMVGHVRPDLRTRGIGDFLIGWAEAKALSLFAEAGAERGMLVVRTESLTEAADSLYRRRGFKQTFEQLVMRRDFSLPLPDCPLPRGVTLANWRAELGEQFYRAYYPAFRDRPGFPGWSAEEWVSHVVGNDLVPEWTLLAQAGDQPVGFVIGCSDLTADPPGGYVWQTGVIPSWRRRGIASALLAEMMRRMQAAGTLWTQLVVTNDNPGAVLTYERLGFTTIGRRAQYERSSFSGSSAGT